MHTSGITRGVAVAAIAALSVAGLPPMAGPATASSTVSVTSVQIVNLRDRGNFDLDELRDGDDFRIVTRDGSGHKVDANSVEFRWTLDTGSGVVTGASVAAERRTRGTYRVKGPSRTMGADGIRDRELGGGSWTLRAVANGVNGTPETVQVAESEISIEGGSVTTPAGGRVTVSGVLKNVNGPLRGRAVRINYTRPTGGDSRFEGGGTRRRVVTDARGKFSVTLEDPSGATWEIGSLAAVGTGEESGDRTQLPHRYGPDDADRPDFDATDAAKVTWQGPPGTAPSRIRATLRGKSNGARADRLKVNAPGKARGAEVRLSRVKHGRKVLVQVSHLNRHGDKKLRVKDRNRKRVTTYVAKVGPTTRTRGDTTNRRRVR